MREKCGQRVTCPLGPPGACVGQPFPIQRFGGFRPEPRGGARGRDGRGEITLVGPYVIFDDRTRQRQVCARIGRRLAYVRSGPRDLLAQRTFGTTLTATRGTTDRNRPEVKPQSFVPVLLLLGSKREGLQTLHAAPAFVQVEIPWDVAHRVEVLVANVSANRTPRQGRRVIRVVSPRLTSIGHGPAGGHTDERHFAVERIVGNASLRPGRWERTATARLTVAVAWVASIGHGRSN